MYIDIFKNCIRRVGVKLIFFKFIPIKFFGVLLKFEAGTQTLCILDD